MMSIGIVKFISKYGGSDANRHRYAVEGFNLKGDLQKSCTHDLTAWLFSIFQ